MSNQQVLLGLFQKFGKQYAKDSIVFFENDEGHDMYIIVSGKVEILKEVIKTEKVEKTKIDKKDYEQLAVLQPGDFFGEMSLLNDKPRSATVRALDVVKVIVLNKNNFELILEKQPQLSLKILKTLSNRIRSLDKLLEDASRTSPGPATLSAPPEEVSCQPPEETLPEEKTTYPTLQEPMGFDIRKWTSWWQSKMFLTAISLDIFNTLSSQELSAEEISKQFSSPYETTDLFLNTLVGLGLLQKENDSFRNSDDLNVFIQTKADALEDLKFENQLYEKWTKLDEMLKKGLDKIDLQDELFRKMLSKMNFSSSEALEALVSAVDLGSAKRFLEIGEAPSLYSIEMVKRLPKVIANVIDRANTIQTTDEFVDQFGLGDKINCQIGDYKDANFGKNYDIIFVAFGLHFTLGVCKDIIVRVYDALNADGYLVVHDMILKDNKLEPPAIASLIFPFLINSGARFYTISEIKCLLEEVGFEVTTGGILKDFSTLIVAKKKK